MNKNKRLFWLDLETTGLTDLSKDGVHTHRILEMAGVITDDRLNVIDSHSVVIHHNKNELLCRCDDVVTRMHTANGLFDDIERSKFSIFDAEKQMIDLLERNGAADRSSPLCGNSIYLDRAFIEAQMPRLNEKLHYRNLDVSSLYEFVKLLDPDFEFKKKKGHRAMGDIMESISEAQHYQWMMRDIKRAADIQRDMNMPL